MTTVPSKHHHQPLHNFSLPFLPWGQRITTSHRHRRRHRNSDRTKPRRNPNNFQTEIHEQNDAVFVDGGVKLIDADVATPANGDVKQWNRDKPHRNRNNFKTEFHEQNDAEFVGGGVKLIGADVATPANGDVKPWNRHKPHRNRNNFKTEIDEQNDAVFTNDADVATATATAANGDVKPWNLRSRRLVNDAVDGNGNVMEVNDEQRKMKKKRMLWISLSKDEIEEDIYAFTGSKPARRPKKRSKIAQKQIDNVFPGLYLVGISADSYRV